MLLAVFCVTIMSVQAKLIGIEYNAVQITFARAIVVLILLMPFIYKLGGLNFLKTKKNKNPLLVACDVYRPAAIDQLHVLGEQLGIEVFSNREEKNPVKIAQEAIHSIKTPIDQAQLAKERTEQHNGAVEKNINR